MDSLSSVPPPSAASSTGGYTDLGYVQNTDYTGYNAPPVGYSAQPNTGGQSLPLGPSPAVTDNADVATVPVQVPVPGGTATVQAIAQPQVIPGQNFYSMPPPPPPVVGQTYAGSVYAGNGNYVQPYVDPNA